MRVYKRGLVVSGIPTRRTERGVLVILFSSLVSLPLSMQLLTTLVHLKVNPAYPPVNSVRTHLILSMFVCLHLSMPNVLMLI